MESKLVRGQSVRLENEVLRELCQAMRQVLYLLSRFLKGRWISGNFFTLIQKEFGRITPHAFCKRGQTLLPVLGPVSHWIAVPRHLPLMGHCLKPSRRYDCTFRNPKMCCSSVSPLLLRNSCARHVRRSKLDLTGCRLRGGTDLASHCSKPQPHIRSSFLFRCIHYFHILSPSP